MLRSTDLIRLARQRYSDRFYVGAAGFRSGLDLVPGLTQFLFMLRNAAVVELPLYEA
jgi:hypothetical protein